MLVLKEVERAMEAGHLSAGVVAAKVGDSRLQVSHLQGRRHAPHAGAHLPGVRPDLDLMDLLAADQAGEIAYELPGQQAAAGRGRRRPDGDHDLIDLHARTDAREIKLQRIPELLVPKIESAIVGRQIDRSEMIPKRITELTLRLRCFLAFL
ncbi:hypothetical protein D3C72_1547920 [compost metagenome]